MVLNVIIQDGLGTCLKGSVILLLKASVLALKQGLFYLLILKVYTYKLNIYGLITFSKR